MSTNTSNNLKLSGHNLITIHNSNNATNTNTNSNNTPSATNSSTITAGANSNSSNSTAKLKQQSNLEQVQNQNLNPGNRIPKGLSQQQQQQLYQIESSQQSSSRHQVLQNGNNAKNILNKTSSQIQYPPRYQPPPQPPPGGILKHIPNHGYPVKSQSSVNLPQHYYHQTEKITTSNGHHLNLKYPPEVPKLAYLPEGIKQPSSRIVPPRVQLRLSSNGSNPVQSNIQQPSQPPRNLHPTPIEEEIFLQRLNQQQLPPPSSQQNQEMLKFVRKSDSEQPSPASSGGGSGSGRISAEQNRHLQNLIAELRALKEANQRLSDDNQELRDLCCFLDDDRQKGRKLAREWQRFGRYTASVMRQEVSAYQNKLRQLDDKQQELIRDNLELKELCLYLDEERANASRICTNCGATTTANNSTLRDDGDGSSSSTNADEPMPTNLRSYDRSVPDLNLRSSLTDQTIQYVRSLERRIQQLEEEQNGPPIKTSSKNSISSKAPSNPTTPTKHLSNKMPTAAQLSSLSADPIINGRPEAVVRALQVLEVREQLAGTTSSASSEQMDDGEKALVREMCNVVWRKLEETNASEAGIDI